MGYNLLINGVYWSCNPFTNHLYTSFLDIQVPPKWVKNIQRGLKQVRTKCEVFFAAICDMENDLKHMGGFILDISAKLLVKWVVLGLKSLLINPYANVLIHLVARYVETEPPCILLNMLAVSSKWQLVDSNSAFSQILKYIDLNYSVSYRKMEE